MSYHQITGLSFGATESDDDNIIEKCGQKIKAADLDTKAGREQSVKTGAECAADGFCAAYKVPPGVCGPIAKTVAGEAIKIWNSIFGDDSAQRAALKRDMETAAYFGTRTRLTDLGVQMSADLGASTKKLIDYHDRLIPSRRGAYGGGKTYSNQIPTWSKDYGEKPITVTGYVNDLPMRQALVKHGLLHETEWIAPHYVDPKSPYYYPVQVPNLDARMLGGIGRPAPADEWVKARLAELTAVCMKQPQGFSQTHCLAQLPSRTALRTEYARSLIGLVEQFYESLSKAELRVRAAIAAEATKVRVMQHTAAGAKAGSTAAFSGGKAAGIILLAGAAAAAIIIYRRK